jgi:hypothetical protein
LIPRSFISALLKGSSSPVPLGRYLPMLPGPLCFWWMGRSPWVSWSAALVRPCR